MALAQELPARGKYLSVKTFCLRMPAGAVEDLAQIAGSSNRFDILLAQETGLPIHVDEDPLTCVVRGTGRILDDYEKYRSVLSV